MSKYADKLIEENKTVWQVYKKTDLKMAKERGRQLKLKAVKCLVEEKLLGK